MAVTNSLRHVAPLMQMIFVNAPLHLPSEDKFEHLRMQLGAAC
jgi:hypothetical protein